MFKKIRIYLMPERIEQKCGVGEPHQGLTLQYCVARFSMKNHYDAFCRDTGEMEASIPLEEAIKINGSSPMRSKIREPRQGSLHLACLNMFYEPGFGWRNLLKCRITLGSMK